jgi:CrcB protein
MQNIVAIALGAAIGANLRYLVTNWAVSRFGTALPYGTFIVNILGCLVIGMLLTLVMTRLHISEALRLFLVTGLLGSLTTFSTFSYESYALISTGNALGAANYIAASVFVGLAAVYLGAFIARLIPG